MPSTTDTAADMRVITLQPSRADIRLSFSGAMASMAILAAAAGISRGQWFGPVGYTVLAALAHMAAQIGTAYVAFVPNPGLFTLLPVFMTAALIFGILNGIIARQMLLRLPPH